LTLFGTIHPTAERGGGAAKSDCGDNGAGTPKTAEDADGILGGGRGHCGLPIEPTPDEESPIAHLMRLGMDESQQ
jgi:hypothetical protein